MKRKKKEKQNKKYNENKLEMVGCHCTYDYENDDHIRTDLPWTDFTCKNNILYK